jgi:hypothetical protein
MFAQKHTISGYVVVNKSGETLINASVYETNSGQGSVSNSYGFYSITLPIGSANLVCSYVGYKAFSQNLELTKDTIINIQLFEITSLNEITVFGHRKGMDVQSSQMSAINIPLTQIKKLPGLLGETDVIKALQLTPGVNSGTEGSAGMYVRGGGPDENLLLLDGVPVYNVNHLMGFFSVFNADAIKDVTLYKGSFPARFGGRLSSVVDIRMNDGNDKEIHGNISVGLLSSKINIEGPLFYKKTTFNVSARRTYADILVQPFIKISAASNNETVKNPSQGYYFYDMNGKLSHKFSDKDRLYLSLYMGDDVVYGNMQSHDEDYGEWYHETGRLKYDWNWGNIISAIRWNHVINNKLFMNTTTSFTQYRFDLIDGTEVTTTMKNPPSTKVLDTEVAYKSNIIDYTTKVDFDWTPNPNHDVKFGLNYINHTFRPGVYVVQEAQTTNNLTQKIDTTYGDKEVKANEISAYFEDDFAINKSLKLNIGLHYSSYYVQGKWYNPLPQPRVGLRYLINDNLSFKASYAAMSQYIHLLSNSNISLPTDLWVPVTKRIPPMQSNQYTTGVYYNFKNIIDFSVEAYYKNMYNLIEYKDGASFLGSSTSWEDKVNRGRGWAYGIEFMAQKSVGKTTGWLGYTWSRSMHLFNLPDQEINNGEVFPAKYDRPHNISLVVMHKFSDKFDISGTWVLSSGNNATLALQYFDGNSIPFYNNAYNEEYVTLAQISSRNNYRFESYHRLDLGLNFHKQKRHGLRTWNISVFNVYNHLNPFIVTVKKEVKSNGNTMQTYIKGLTKTSIFPIIPSVSYSYKF